MDRKVIQKMKAIARAEGVDDPAQLFSATPTRFLYIGNGGSQAGVRQSQLLSLLERFGRVEVLLLPGKPYAFAAFEAEAGAVTAREQLHGVSNDDLHQTLYVFFAHDDRRKQLVLQQEQAPSNVSALGVDGLHLLEEWISSSTEEELVRFIDSQPWTCLSHRRVQHYGAPFEYGQAVVDRDRSPEEFPPLFRDIADRIAGLECMTERPDQLTVNEYLPGSGIAPHIDSRTIFGESILSLSLCSPVVMGFREGISTPSPQKELLLPPRSLLVMTGPSRHLWFHGIAKRKVDLYNGVSIERRRRISLTFRAIRRTTAAAAAAAREQ